MTSKTYRSGDADLVIFSGLDFDVAYFDPLAPDSGHRVAIAPQPVHSQIAITLRVIGSAEHECLFCRRGHTKRIQTGTYFVQIAYGVTTAPAR